MRILTPGHCYVLANHEDPEKGGQTLQFIEKRPEEPGPNAPLVMSPSGHAPIRQPTGRFITVNNGTTNEEVLRVLVDRIQTLNAKVPCRENAIALTHIETALLWLEQRTRCRVARGVENTPKP